MGKTVIRRSRWSTSYKEGSKFIKEYVYNDAPAIQREALASRAALETGLLTPQYIGAYVQAGKSNAVFEYHDIHKLDEEVACIPFYMKQIFDILELLKKVPWDNNDTYWYKQLDSFHAALGYIEEETDHLVLFLQGLIPSIFIHGDFTCDNIGISEQNVIIYDFQHGSLGPSGWDKAYLASTLTPQNSATLNLDNTELKMALAISAIRYGRGIRKNSDHLGKRQALYQQWKKVVKW